jgi:hypothetical protein
LLDKKIGFLDLCYLRVGIFVSEEPMPGVPGYIVVKFRPPGIFSRVVEIPNVPVGALITVTKEELGGISTFDVWKVLLAGEQGSSHFLDRILKEKYDKLVEEIEKLKKELEIRKAVEASKTIQYSRDVLNELERLKEISKKLEGIVKPKKPGLRKFVAGEVE